MFPLSRSAGRHSEFVWLGTNQDWCAPTSCAPDHRFVCVVLMSRRTVSPRSFVRVVSPASVDGARITLLPVPSGEPLRQRVSNLAGTGPFQPDEAIIGASSDSCRIAAPSESSL